MAFNGEGHVSKRSRSDGAAGLLGNHNGQNFLMKEDQGNPLKKSRDDPDKMNHILLFTVINPVYPITVDVLHTICSPSGNVQRIVIFKKNGVQAMVEFDGVESAKRAKDSLHGCDIYSGCCTLKIEYAKPAKLNVYKNDPESWDYTAPTLGRTEPPTATGRPAPLLQEPRFGTAPTPFRREYRSDSLRPALLPQYGATGGHDRFENGLSSSHNGPFSEHFQAPTERFSDRFSGKDGLRNGPSIRTILGAGTPGGSPPRGTFTNPTGVGGAGFSPSPIPQQGAVMMVYGLNPDKMNSDKLFNLFCLYGNVVRIKFLKTKEGCAMVQLGDTASVDRAIQNLNNSTFFNEKLQLGYSKQVYLSDVQQPYTLPDGTASFKDYMGNKNNRFINPGMAGKNRIQPPSKILHFFNTPPGLTDEQLQQVFTDLKVIAPKTVKMFASKTERSSSGLMEFESVSQALEALVVGNHHPIPNPSGKFPFTMKLCFSSSRHMPNAAGGQVAVGSVIDQDHVLFE